MRKSKNKMFIAGKTVDGKKVVGGLFKYFDTTGIPLDIIFEQLKATNIV